METLTHLKTSADFINSNNRTYSQLVIDKFIESCLHLDASIFEPYMEEGNVFEEKEKYKSLSELKELFDNSRLKANNSFKVNMANRECMGCNSGEPVLNFKVMQKGKKLPVNDFGFLIERENGILKDIYRCHLYMSYSCAKHQDK